MSQPLGDQVFILRGNEAYSLRKMIQGVKPIQNSGLNKPNGGFWTSSLKGASSAWLNWCSAEMPEWVGPRAVILTPLPQVTNIFHLDNQTGLDFLSGIFPWVEGQKKFKFMSDGEKLIDWERVFQTYDAVHISADMARTRVLESWQVESTLWARASMLRIKAVVDVKNHCQLKLASRRVAGQWIRRVASSS